MRIDFSRGLVGLDGNVMTQPVIGADGKPAVDEAGEAKRETIALATICINALMADLESDKNATGVEKLARWDFASRIHNAKGALDLTPKEVADLQDRVGTGFGTVVVGPALRMLNGDGENK